MASPRTKPLCQGVLSWLRNNLGREAMGALTGTDHRALGAVVHILELYQYAYRDHLLTGAFHDVVMQMQPGTREFAYHAVAFMMDWSDRDVIWSAAGLPLLGSVSVCAGERR